MYRILHNDDDVVDDDAGSTRQASPCCLDLPNIGTPSPDWAELGNPTYNGILQDPFSNQTAHEWIFDNVNRNDNTIRMRDLEEESPAEMYHTTRQVAHGPYAGRPLLFTFPSALGRQDYHYLFETMVEEHLEPDLFRLPEWCQQQTCQ